MKEREKERGQQEGEGEREREKGRWKREAGGKKRENPGHRCIAITVSTEERTLATRKFG